MSTDGIRVEEFNIFALGGQAVSYHLKNIHTVALQVTEGNIGGLSLELEVELCYYNNGTPFMEAYFARGTNDKPETDRYANVKVGDWFVILWDEIHVFRDKEFRSTFSFDGLSGISMEEAREQHGLNEERPPYVPTDAVPATDLETDKTVWFRPKAYNSLDNVAKERFRLFEPALRMNAERTQIVPASGNLYPEGEGPKVDAETEQKIGERIDSQPWMQQAKAELQEKDGGNTREQQL